MKILLITLLVISSFSTEAQLKRMLLFQDPFAYYVGNGGLSITFPSASNHLEIPYPTNIISGDDLALMICADGTAAYDELSGWTKRRDVYSFGNFAYAYYTKTATGLESGSVDVLSTATGFHGGIIINCRNSSNTTFYNNGPIYYKNNHVFDHMLTLHSSTVVIFLGYLINETPVLTGTNWTAEYSASFGGFRCIIAEYQDADGSTQQQGTWSWTTNGYFGVEALFMLQN